MAITLQDIFNAAVQKFIVEKGEPAVVLVHSGRWSCRYLTQSGCKCAIGLVIPDGHPAQKALGAFPSLVRKWPELWSQEIIKEQGILLALFQKALHDDLIDGATGTWRLSLEERIKAYFKVAHEYKLSIPDSLNEVAI